MITGAPVAPGPLTALVVDDEKIARAGLRVMLSAHPGVTVVGEAATGIEALRAIRALKPDIVFLDIQMPDRNGFGVLQHLDREYRPAIVFVTAYTEHALKAYEAGVVDYLHKPFSQQRLAETLRRVIRFIRGGGRKGIDRNGERSGRLLVRSGADAVFLELADISTVTVVGNYLHVRTQHREFLVRRTLGSLAAELRGSGFLRVSRTTMVNLAHVRALRRESTGRYQILLEGEGSVSSSRRYAAEVRRALAAAASRPPSG